MPIILKDPNGYRFTLAGRELIVLNGGAWDGWLAARAGDRWEVLRFPEEGLRARIVEYFRREATARHGSDAAELIRLIDGKGGEDG